jgi:phosphoribosylformylglycinamidine (FGAM) synthase-like enzyme
MDAQTGDVSGASVQIGAPITEKNVIEVLLRARDAGLYSAVTDCGAGGLSSAVGEMASTIGVEIDLARVPLKYPGLAPWEIWLSEAQERMVFAVPRASLAALQALCDLFGVEMTDLGDFRGDGRLVVRYAGETVLDLQADFLHHGRPQRRLKAHPPKSKPQPESISVLNLPEPGDALLSLLAHPNIASKEPILRLYDHEVQGATCVKPLSGPGCGPSDATVLKPVETPGFTGIALSTGFNPEYGKVDPYRMALCVVDEAVRNAVAAGADPDRLALLDNFCWGDPQRSEMMWALLEAARGCYEAAVAHRAPFISGKDSFNNEYLTRSGVRQAIPPSLLISSLGILPDVRRTVTLDFKQPGSILYLVGDFNPTYGGTHFALCFGLPEGAPSDVPLPSTGAPALYRALHRAMQIEGLVSACHDLSEGGLGVAAAEMCIAGQLGLDLDLPGGAFALFGETAGCLLIAAAPGREAELERALAGQPIQPVGRVIAEPVFTINGVDRPLFSLPVADLAAAWQTPLSGGRS